MANVTEEDVKIINGLWQQKQKAESWVDKLDVGKLTESEVNALKAKLGF